MITINADNAAIVYIYQGELKQAEGLKKSTMRTVLRHIWQFDSHLGSIDFRKVTREMIADFKDDLIEKPPEDCETSRGASTIVKTLRNLKRFFTWLSQQRGYKRAITPQIINYFAPPREYVALSEAAAPKVVPTPDEIRKILFSMPADAPADRRDRVMLAALFLFGLRDGALITLRMKHVDVDRKLVYQDAREVKTKFSKSNIVNWFPVGEDIEAIVIDWFAELRAMGAGDDHPLIPNTPFKPWVGARSVELDFLTSAAPVRKVIAAAAAKAGVPRFKAHSVRAAIARHCDQFATTDKIRKALSQNLSHVSISTTDKYYGDVDDDQKREIFASLRERQRNPVALNIVELFEQVDEETQKLICGFLRNSARKKL